jgi:HAL2 family 3'(2'),5'-bisphosphate nucleotidase
MSCARQAEMAAAIEAVTRATGVCQTVQRQMVDAQTIAKKDRSPVTVADFASQAIICATLAEAFPSDAVVGEEDAAVLREDGQAKVRQTVVRYAADGLGKQASADEVLGWIDRGASVGDEERYWTVDPIDGTKGFLRGEQYAVALALLEAGQIVLGVLGCPNMPFGNGTGLILAATKGCGARALPLDGTWDSGEPIHVSATSDVAAARFCESVESGHSNQSASAQIAKALGITHEPLRIDSQAKYAAVAQGQAQIYLRLPTRADYRECIWDHAAGVLIVEQAGGRITDVDGKVLDFTHGRKLEANRGIIGTNGPIHDAVLEAVAKTLA